MRVVAHGLLAVLRFAQVMRMRSLDRVQALHLRLPRRVQGPRLRRHPAAPGPPQIPLLLATWTRVRTAVLIVPTGVTRLLRLDRRVTWTRVRTAVLLVPTGVTRLLRLHRRVTWTSVRTAVLLVPLVAPRSLVQRAPVPRLATEIRQVAAIRRKDTHGNPHSQRARPGPRISPLRTAVRQDVIGK